MPGFIQGMEEPARELYRSLVRDLAEPNLPTRALCRQVYIAAQGAQRCRMPGAAALLASMKADPAATMEATRKFVESDFQVAITEGKLSNLGVGNLAETTKHP